MTPSTGRQWLQGEKLRAGSTAQPRRTCPGSIAPRSPRRRRCSRCCWVSAVQRAVLHLFSLFSPYRLGRTAIPLICGPSGHTSGPGRGCPGAGASPGAAAGAPRAARGSAPLLGHSRGQPAAKPRGIKPTLAPSPSPQSWKTQSAGPEAESPGPCEGQVRLGAAARPAQRAGAPAGAPGG